MDLVQRILFAVSKISNELSWYCTYAVFNTRNVTSAIFSFSSVFSCLLSVPDAPDVWVWVNRDNTGQVIWKVIFFNFKNNYFRSTNKQNLLFLMQRAQIYIMFT